jgi:DNA ligase-1
MSSPAKRRRLNGFNATDRPVRGLDFFFAKQREAQKEKTQERSLDANQDPPEPTDIEDGHGLTDEELARKLQAQWTEEDGKSNDVPSVHHETGQNELVHDHEVAQIPHATTQEVSGNTGNPSFQLGVASEQSKNTLALQFTATDEDAVTANIPFDESPLTFEPSKYIPDLQKEWEADGGHASYALLTRCFVLVNGTQSRIKIVDTLVNLLRTVIEVDPDSLLPTVCPCLSSYLCSSLTFDTGLAINERNLPPIHRS